MSRITKYLKPGDVSRRLNVPAVTLGRWRRNKTVDLPYIRLGSKIIRYAESDVERLLNQSRRNGN